MWFVLTIMSLPPLLLSFIFILGRYRWFEVMLKEAKILSWKDNFLTVTYSAVLFRRTTLSRGCTRPHWLIGILWLQAVNERQSVQDRYVFMH